MGLRDLFGRLAGRSESGDGPPESAGPPSRPGEERERVARRPTSTPAPRDVRAHRMREELVERVEAMFGEFGPVICSYMLSQALTQGGVARVVQKLDLRSRGRDGADMAQVENWILRHGVEKFHARTGLRENAAHATPPPEVENSPTHDPHPAKPHVRPLREETSPRASSTAVRVKAVNRQSPRETPTAPSHVKRVDIKPVGLRGGTPPAEEERKPEKPPPQPPSPSSTGTKPPFPFTPKRLHPPGEDDPGEPRQ